MHWTAPADLDRPHEPWSALLCQPSISCHFLGQDKVTQLDCILIIWQEKEVWQMLRMDLVTPLSAAAQGLEQLPRSHPWSTGLVLDPWCWATFK